MAKNEQNPNSDIMTEKHWNELCCFSKQKSHKSNQSFPSNLLTLLICLINDTEHSLTMLNQGAK